ncbi:MAG: hypothetical protein FGF52_00795 [Candidatus Brockarchaeota archaeon]|nr:hypothetical protein [Candidatus Brockarchaeota archaeon]
MRRWGVRLLKDLAAIAALPNVEYVALTPDITLASVYLRQTLNLTFSTRITRNSVKHRWEKSLSTRITIRYPV